MNCCIEGIEYNRKIDAISFIGSYRWYPRTVFSGIIKYPELSLQSFRHQSMKSRTKYTETYDSYLLNSSENRKYFWQVFREACREEYMYLLPVDDLLDTKLYLYRNSPKGQCGKYYGTYYNRFYLDFSEDGVDNIILLVYDQILKNASLNIYEYPEDLISNSPVFSKDLGKVDYLYPSVLINKSNKSEVYIPTFPQPRFGVIEDAVKTRGFGNLLRLSYMSESSNYMIENLGILRTRNPHVRVFRTRSYGDTIFSLIKSGTHLVQYDLDMNVINRWKLGNEFLGMRIVSDLNEVLDHSCVSRSGPAGETSIKECYHFLAVISKTRRSCSSVRVSIRGLLSDDEFKCKTQFLKLNVDNSWSKLFEHTAPYFDIVGRKVMTSNSVIYALESDLVEILLRDRNFSFVNQ